MIRKNRLWILCLSLIGAFSAGVFAEDMSQVFFNLIKVELNGKLTDAQTILYQGTTYVPIRFVAEELGAEVKWDGQNKKVVIQNAPQSVQNPMLPQFQQGGTQMMLVPVQNMPSEEDAKIRKEMESHIHNIDMNAQTLILDGTVAMLVTPQNQTGYHIKNLVAEYRHNLTGKTYRLKWYDMEANGVGEQQRINFSSDVKGGSMNMSKMKVTFSDGQKEHYFEIKYE